MTSRVTSSKVLFPGVRLDRLTDSEGRDFDFAYVENPNAQGLVVHFSALFGGWSGRGRARPGYDGYFQRLRMLSGVSRYDWLFLCDQHGIFDNGSYYAGHRGDFFVERGIHEIIDRHRDRLSIGSDRIVTVGSSMGATGALKFGLAMGVRGIVAIAPHIDLDICARAQGREAEIGYICPDDDPYSEHNYPYTRQIRTGLSDGRYALPLPRLFIQTCADDTGVYPDQVIPLVAQWQQLGGKCDLDLRTVGGHTSTYAGRTLLLDVIDAIFEVRAINLREAARKGTFASKLSNAMYESQYRVRRRLSSTEERISGAEPSR